MKIHVSLKNILRTFNFVHYTFYFILLFFITSLTAQPLTQNSQISLLTETSGEALYFAFGHSQIRILDPQLGLDQVYNYGVFDLEKPGFYTNFMKGRLEYLLAAYPTEYAFRSSQRQGRGQTEQVLNLSVLQKNRLFAFLENNALPKNRTYLYDYFYDNCSSRIRDIFDKILGDTLKWDYSTSSNAVKDPKQVSIRDYMNEFLIQTKDKYGRLGLDILLGMPTDKKLSPKEEMFLPYYLMYHLDKATVKTATGAEPFVKQKKVLIEPTLQFKKQNPSPSLVFWILFGLGLVLTVWQIRSENFNRIFDRILFLLTGLLGCLIVFLWFFTDHQAAAVNLNILWAMPFNLIAFFVLFSQKWMQVGKWYFGGYAGLLVLLLLSWSFLPQGLNYDLIPLVMVLALRSGFLSWRLFTHSKAYPHK